jgi:hypothetical protein
VFESGVEKARAALGKLTEARGQLEEKAATAAGELAKLREGAGEVELAELLEGVDAGPVRARIVEIDARVSGLAAARVVLLKRIAAAQQALQTAKADEIRAEARKKQTALEKHIAESNRLRQALERHEGGCPYITRAQSDQEFYASHPGVAPPHNIALKWPLSHGLQGEINALLAKASATQQARQSDRGSTTGANLQELLAAIGENPLAPAAEEIKATFAEMEAAAIAAWDRHITNEFSKGTGPRPDERVTSYTIAWQDGRVDRTRSMWANDRRAERFDPNKPKPAATAPTASTEEATAYAAW